MSFTLPSDLRSSFEEISIQRYQEYYAQEEERVNARISEGLKPHFDSTLLKPVVEGRTLVRVERSTLRITQAAKASVDHAVFLLENRVNGSIAVNETVTPLNLRLNSYDSLLEGNLAVLNEESTQVATLCLRMMWNYRYGENSSNGHLTQYVQFRCNRSGKKLEGKTQVQVVQDDKKAEKAAAKAEKRIAAKARFEKGLIREAKRYERNAADLDKYPEYNPEVTQAHLDHWASLKKDYLAVAASLRKATAETPFHKANEETTVFDRFGGSASSYADHLSNRRPTQNNA